MRWFGGGFRCKAKPDCFGSRNHTPQTRAENGCRDCRWVDSCLDNQTDEKAQEFLTTFVAPVDITEQQAMPFLEMAGQGCISGQCCEWPQLVPSCRWAHNKILYLKDACSRLDKIIQQHNIQASYDRLPKYAILNDFDKPCPRLVAQFVNGRYYYLSRQEEPNMKQYDGMFSEKPTDIQDFGFSVLERGGIVHFCQTLDSIAMYKDGKEKPPGAAIRLWQDRAQSFHYKMVTVEDLK